MSLTVTKSTANPSESRYDELISPLRAGVSTWRDTTIEEKIRMLRQARRRLAEEAPAIIASAAAAQDVPVDSRYLGGLHLSIAPLPILMRAYEDALRRLKSHDSTLPKRAVTTTASGRVLVDVFPRTAADRILYSAWGYRARVLMQPGTGAAEVLNPAADAYRRGGGPSGGVALALGPGNTAAGPATDIVDLLVGHGCTVLAKLNPVTAYLRPHFERVFADFVDAGWLRFVDGDATVGTALAHHSDVDRIHLTGSADTYLALRWGTGAGGAHNLAAGTPALDKPFTAELGGVGPMIVAPGRWTRADLRRQADRILGARTAFCGHTCAAPQLLILPRGWEHADALVDEIRALVDQQTPGQRYYPGTEAKAAAALAELSAAEGIAGAARRTVLADVEADSSALLCRKEVFTDVLGIMRLPARTVSSYLAAATEYANDGLPGTLCASLLIDPATARRERRALGQTLSGLRYGSIGLNEWGAGTVLVGYPPWGAFPGHTPQNPGSGFGFVHNAYLLAQPEKTVFTARFRTPIKPLTAASHRTLEPMGRALMEYLCSDDPRALPRMMAAAVAA